VKKTEDLAAKTGMKDGENARAKEQWQNVRLAGHLRQGIIMKEILGPSRAIKPYRFPLYR
jgi:hypothetical protein